MGTSLIRLYFQKKIGFKIFKVFFSPNLINRVQNTHFHYIEEFEASLF